MSKKPSLVRGTRDYLPSTMAKRNYIYNVLKETFVKFGFAQIETPAIELSETLMGKYGEEGDRLIFRVLNNGDKLKKANINALESDNTRSFADSISERALRYDLTVPFARFVVQNRNELTFPFKRYQIQPVWRADRPQKGRYREFYQCDVDVVGSDSLLYEIECIQIFDEVLSKLGLKDFTIKINNRKILSGISEVLNAPDKLTDITVAIDKLDKIGKDGVIEELRSRGLEDKAIKSIDPLFDLTGSNTDKLQKLQVFLANSPIGLKGIEELEYVLTTVGNIGLKKANLNFDVTLARGLNYYTGAIFEVVTNEVKMGSICGGGRYDDLTALFGLKEMSGIGISFGADRIYDVMEELNLFPTSITQSADILLTNLSKEAEMFCLEIAQKIRENSFSCEIYPDSTKLQKQMKYANNKNIKRVGIVGDEELAKKVISLKNMESGEQLEVSVEDLISELINDKNVLI